MEASFKIKNVLFKTTVENQKDLFREWSAAHEVFGEETCGLCGSDHIYPVWRTVSKGKKTFEYPEYHCRECHARLALSFNLEGGTMFVNRKLLNGLPATGEDRDKGQYGQHNGWYRYQGQDPGGKKF